MVEGPWCVYCRRQLADPVWRPFCSERCKMADLGRWLSGDYRVASAGADPADEDGADETSAEPPPQQ